MVLTVPFENFSDLNNSRFIAIDLLGDFEQAKTECLTRDATLARISNNEEHFFVQQFLDSIVTIPDSAQFWIGVEDVQKVGGRNPERFSFVDGSQDGLDFFEIGFEFPWQSGQPNDVDGNEDCVEFARPDADWRDIDCATPRRILCRQELNQDEDDDVAPVNDGENNLALAPGGFIGFIVVALLFLVLLILLERRKNRIIKLRFSSFLNKGNGSKKSEPSKITTGIVNPFDKTHHKPNYPYANPTEQETVRVTVLASEVSSEVDFEVSL